jgi:hypothetical protein
MRDEQAIMTFARDVNRGLVRSTRFGQSTSDLSVYLL